VLISVPRVKENNMTRKHVIGFVGLLLVLMMLGLTACGAGDTTGAPEVAASSGNNGAEVGTAGDSNEGPTAPAATLTVAEQYPETLIIHPDATGIEARPTAGVYVYIVPLTSEETLDYMLEEMKALGWEELGRPSLVGHLATINMQMGRSRVAISMQYNERSQTTRVQLSLMK
jgi:hypothetical protein